MNDGGVGRVAASATKVGSGADGFIVGPERQAVSKALDECVDRRGGGARSSAAPNVVRA